MIAFAKSSTDHEELHHQVHRIQEAAWEGYGTLSQCTRVQHILSHSIKTAEYVALPQRMPVQQPTADGIIWSRTRPPADDTATFLKAFLVAWSDIDESSNVRISEVLPESFESLCRATEKWRHFSIKSDVSQESLQAFTEASEITPLCVRTLLERTDESDWNDAKNDRRCELIDKEIEGTLLPAERRDLEELQRQMLAYRRKVAPLPLKEVQRLHQQLLKKAAEQED